MEVREGQALLGHLDSQHADRRRASGTTSRCAIAGTKVAGYLDGKLYLEHVLPQPVSGRIGLWSKADSHVYFDDFTVTPAD